MRTNLFLDSVVNSWREQASDLLGIRRGHYTTRSWCSPAHQAGVAHVYQLYRLLSFWSDGINTYLTDCFVLLPFIFSCALLYIPFTVKLFFMSFFTCFLHLEVFCVITGLTCLLEYTSLVVEYSISNHVLCV